MERTGKRGKAKLTRTSVSKTNSNAYTLDELFNIYMFAKEAEGMAKSTLTSKRYYFSTFTTYLKENHAITNANDVSSNVIREFLYYLKNDHVKHQNNDYVKTEYKSNGVSVAYINTILGHMKTFNNFLLTENYFDGDNPFNKIKSLKNENDHIEALTTEQIKE